MSYLSTSEMVRNTELEILADALDQEPEELEGYIDDEAQVDDLEEVSGWDDRPLGDEEQWETTINGHDNNNNFDRPLQLAQEMGYERALATMQQNMVQLHTENNSLREQLNPNYQQNMRQQEDALIEAAYSDPVQFYHNVVHQQHQSHVNASLGEAHAEHGEDFERAFSALTSRNPADPRARADVEKIYTAPNAGSALMRWWDNWNGDRETSRGGGHSRGSSYGHIPASWGGTPARSAPRSQGAARRSASMPFEEHDDIGGYDPRAEKEIWRDATRF
jgi:hypothetical protein